MTLSGWWILQANELISNNDGWWWSMVQWNWRIRLWVTVIESVSWEWVSVCELGPDQQRKGFVLEIDREQQVCAKKLKKLAQTSLPVLRPASSLLTVLVKSSRLVYVGMLSVMTYMGRLSSRWVPFSGFRYKMIGISQVEVYERVGKSVI